MPDPSTRPRTTRLSSAGLGVSVSSSGVALVDWLCEFWDPWLHAKEEREGRDPWLEIEVGEGALARALDGAVATGARASCFTFDDGGGEWAVHRASDGEVLVDETGTVALSVSHGDVSCVRVLSDADTGPVRLAALRVVRELVTSQAQSRGAITLHASAVAGADGSVTLFVGRKGAGKTTRLLTSLQRPGTSLVTNDRVLLEQRDGGFHVHGLPTVVSLRAPTLELFPDLGAELDSKDWHFAATVADGDAFRRERNELSELLGRPRGISPTQLCALLDRPAAVGGALGRIVFPRAERSDEPGTGAIPLDPGAAAERILTDGLVAAGHSATYLPGTAPQSPARLEAVVHDLVRVVHCFDAVVAAKTTQPVA